MSTDVRSRSRFTINGRSYAVDSGWGRVPLPAQRQLVDQGDEPSERSLDNPGIWRRSQRDFRGGMGQKHFDREDSRRDRFSTCFNMKVTEDGLETSPDFAQQHNWSGLPIVANAVGVVSNGTYCYAWASDDIVWITGDPTGTWDTSIPDEANSLLNGILVYEKFIFSQIGSKQLKQSALGSSTTSNFGSAMSIWPSLFVFSSGRLLVAGSPSALGTGYQEPASDIYEVDSSGTETLVWNSPDTNTDITSFAASPGGVYFSMNENGTGRIMYLGVSALDGTFTHPVEATALPGGEEIMQIGYYVGVVIIVTNKGVRVAVPDNQGFLSYGPLVVEAETQSRLPSAVQHWDGLAFNGNEVLFAWPYLVGTKDDPVDSTTAADYDILIGAIDLARFVEPLKPAVWFEHLFEDGSGLWAHINPMVFHQGKFVFAPGIVQSEILCRATDDSSDTTPYDSNTTTSQFYPGVIDFGTAETKRFTKVVFELAAATANWNWQVDYRIDRGSWVTGTLRDVETTTLTETLTDVTGRTIEFRLRFTPDAGAAAKLTLTQWTAEAIPTPYRPTTSRYPIILSDIVDYEGHEIPTTPYDEYVWLNSLAQTRQVVETTFGALTEDVYVDGITADPEQDMNWDFTKDWPRGTYLLDVVSVNV